MLKSQYNIPKILKIIETKKNDKKNIKKIKLVKKDILQLPLSLIK